jgi:DNA-binding transcriptional MerR regulator
VTAQDGQEYLTYKEAAERFHVADSTIRSWARARLIRRHRKPMDKKVYVRVSEIEAMQNATPKAEE